LFNVHPFNIQHIKVALSKKYRDFFY
jgi:hypothetical protein